MAQATRPSRSTSARSGAPSRSRSSARAGAAQQANEHAMARMSEGTDKTVLASVTSGPTHTSAPAAAQVPSADELLAMAKAISVQKDADKAVAEGKADMDMSRISHKAVVAEIAGAAGTFKTAINLEVAAVLAVYWQAKGVNIGSKKELYSVYNDAGYDCKAGGDGKDYKTVNRRIGYIGKLYESLPEGTLDGVVGDKTEHDALRLLVTFCAEKYNFKSMNDVLYAAGVEPPSKAQYRALKDFGSLVTDTQMKGEVFDTPTTGDDAGPQTGGSAPQGGQPQDGGNGGGAAGPTDQTPASAATSGVAGAVAAAGEQRQTEGARASAADPAALSLDASKWVKVTFEGATLICPVDMRTECLADLGIKLMTLANHMGSEKVDAVKLAEAFKEVAHH